MPEPAGEFLSGRTARATARRAVDLIGALLFEETSAESVRQVLLSHGEREPLELAAADIVRLRATARELLPVFGAAGADEAARVLNSLLARACPPRLTSHGGSHAWHLHVDSTDDAPMDEWILTSSSLALAVLLAERQQVPGGLCASPRCGRPFVDTGSGGPRRYCSARCATRERVAAHRREGGGPR
ncbi:CGNR zinc finger domain-containing protein [Amycolatopsis palatopharyngis]|uniref:CGNR zinc finger domain-containing protein n=1 Tax=Amycolatopsis palatopharyngis TaxID=187982 RepID=UPI000E23ACB8|nr:CGNR zinc finger domain-containing protein [Amycolatopsis palatopharyngis]